MTPGIAIGSQEALDRALGQRLVDRGRLRAAEYNEVLTEQMVAGGTLALNLWELGLGDPEELSRWGAELLRLPALSQAQGQRAEPAALEAVERDFATRARLLPFAIEGRRLCVASSQPWQLDLLDEAAARTGMGIDPYFMCDVVLYRLLHRHYGVLAPPRYRAQPIPRTRAATRTEKDEDGSEAPLEELTSEEEFLRLYAGDWAGMSGSTALDRGAAQAGGEALDEEELLLSDPADEPVVLSPVSRLSPIASASDAILELERARDRAELGRVLVRFGLSFAPRVALFTCRRGAWLGWTGAGEGLDPERVAGLMVPVVDGTAFGLVHHGGAPLLGPLAPHPVHRAFCAALGTREGSSVGLFPVHHRGRVLFVLYLDAGSSPSLQVAEILILAQRVPATLERMVARRRERAL